MNLLTEYKKTLKLLEVEEIFDLFFYRPLAFAFVKLIYNTNITPNQLTIVSLIFGLLGGASYVLGTYSAYIAGAILYLLYNIFDCSDGQLARLKNSGTPLGRIFDGFVDYVVSIALYFGIGLGFANNTDNPVLWWILTVIAGISNATHSILLDFFRNRFLDYALSRESILDDGLEDFQNDYENLKKQSGKIFEKIIIGAYIKYSSLQNKLTSGKKSTKKIKKFDATNYCKKNRILIHCWTYLGPTTQWTFLIVCSLLNRLDLYLLGIIFVLNFLLIIMYLIQIQIDHTITLETEVK